MIENLNMAIAAFTIAALGTVGFGVYITLLADELAERTRLGRAVIGAIFLGALTSVAEVGTSISAALQQHAELAVQNAVGSIAAQTAFIALADFAYRRANLEHAAATPANLMLAGLLILLLSLLLLATATAELSIFYIQPVSVLVLVAYIYGMRLVARTGQSPMWLARYTAETDRDEQNRAPGHSGSLAWVWMRFFLVSIALAGCGALLANSGIALSRLTGLSETFVGVLLTGVTSSMPELVTAVTAVRIGALTLAISNIIGGNTFDAVIVAFADLVYTPGSIFADAGDGLPVLLSTCLLMNTIVMLGLIRRERHGLANIGMEGVLLLSIYAGLVYWLVQ